VTSKQTTTLSSDSSRIVTITGEVVKYEPGQTIVLRQPDKKVVTYTLGYRWSKGSVQRLQYEATQTVVESGDTALPMTKAIHSTSISAEGQTKDDDREGPR
jgi:hypothetical protein